MPALSRMRRAFAMLVMLPRVITSVILPAIVVNLLCVYRLLSFATMRGVRRGARRPSWSL
eukprot:3795863-Lingulodinium_polyedra.AAC.1